MCRFLLILPMNLTTIWWVLPVSVLGWVELRGKESKSLFFRFFSIIGYYKVVNTIPCVCVCVCVCVIQVIFCVYNDLWFKWILLEFACLAQELGDKRHTSQPFYSELSGEEAVSRGGKGTWRMLQAPLTAFCALMWSHAHSQSLAVFLVYGTG